MTAGGMNNDNGGTSEMLDDGGGLNGFFSNDFPLPLR
jgi:hypothetical protein